MTNSDFKYSSLPSTEEHTEIDVESIAHLDVIETKVKKMNSSSPIKSSEKTSSPIPEEPQNHVPATENHTSSNSNPTSFLMTVIAWTSMILALIAGASIGPTFRYMLIHGVQPCLGVVWRSQTMITTLMPFAIFERLSNVNNKVDWFGYKPDLPYPVIVHMFFSGTAWASGLLFWVIGLRFISTYKASVVATCHPILLVIFLRITGNVVSWYEWIGVFIAFFGVLVSNFSNFIEGDGKADPNAASDMSKVPIYLQALGVFLCLLAAAGEVAVIVNRIRTRKYVPLLQYTVGTTFVVLFYASLTTLILENSHVIESNRLSICFNNNCIFGWMSQYWRWKMLIFGLWVGAVCITGFNYAMSYIPPLVFSSLSLLDPTITAILSWIFGLEGLPTMFSWLGGVVVILGVAIISYGEKMREKNHHHRTPPVATTVTETNSDEEGGDIELVEKGSQNENESTK